MVNTDHEYLLVTINEYSLCKIIRVYTYNINDLFDKETGTRHSNIYLSYTLYGYIHIYMYVCYYS